MQKTKIGISAGCFGAVIYLAGVTGGLLLAAILIGYVLLVEENLWLRRCAVKAGALLFIFSMCILAIVLKALNMSTIVMPGVEKFVDQCMNMNDKI